MCVCYMLRVFMSVLSQGKRLHNDRNCAGIYVRFPSSLLLLPTPMLDRNYKLKYLHTNIFYLAWEIVQSEIKCCSK